MGMPVSDTSGGQGRAPAARDHLRKKAAGLPGVTSGHVVKAAGSPIVTMPAGPPPNLVPHIGNWPDDAIRTRRSGRRGRRKSRRGYAWIFVAGIGFRMDFFGPMMIRNGAEPQVLPERLEGERA